LCAVAIGVIGDICRALGDNTEAYVQGFMGALLQTLQSTTLNRNVKISVLSCFGDIALAIGAKFEPFLEHTMVVLGQAGELTADENDYDMIDYVQSLREGIVEAYIGIVTALKSGSQGHAIQPYVPAMIDLIRRSLSDDERTESLVKLAVGLLGDLADAFRSGELRELLIQEWVLNALKIKGRGYSPDTKKTLKWARDMIKIATASPQG